VIQTSQCNVIALTRQLPINTHQGVSGTIEGEIPFTPGLKTPLQASGIFASTTGE
jgi:hypothetical protein